ncbi:cation:proton antiporter [Streptomyces noursei]|uniref:cation:proton antiporter n=1 Tax=Streptomyces noursei TaxID=1971 RepID=UPI00045EFEFC|nr:cation:proton antiporter [Streptomyces noursei]AIA08050.1 sodium/hydrogen exchanger [Streptomyces noursei]
MTLSTVDVAHLLVALLVLVVAAHAAGRLFARFRQPPVIGEIVGGLLLGPTVLGALAPHFTARLFPATGPVATGLDAVNQIGLLLLMFLAGAELRIRAGTKERRTAAIIAAAGLVLPFAVGVLVVLLIGHRDVAGPNGTALSLALVFGIATAVAAIPVISRIIMDLGIQDTPFARIVLMVAVAEDAVLYIVLAVVLGLAAARSDGAGGLWNAIGTDAPLPTMAYYLVATLVFFAVCTAWGPRLFRWLASRRWNLVERQNPTAFRLAALFAGVAVCAALGINTVFGALMAGICAARSDSGSGDLQAEGRSLHAWEAIRHFSLAFFVPVYFALVGLRLDLARQLDPVFFVWFLALACLVKGGSVWLAGMVTGEGRGASTRLAVALNARGTPGILLASVTYGAGIINAHFFAALVLMSIVTCQIAGFWLERACRRDARATRPPAARPGPLTAPEPESTAPTAIPQEVP